MKLTTQQQVAIAQALRSVAQEKAFSGHGAESDDLGNIADLIATADAVEITHHEDGARSSIEQLTDAEFDTLTDAVDNDLHDCVEEIQLAKSEGRAKDADAYSAKHYHVEQLRHRLLRADACQLCTGPAFRPFGDAEESTAEAASC